ncbi:MAG: hypothetical protein NDI60_08350 [Elusimicrobiales bacterium]|nr:hypothetical protein [Elusimicrobiales bacterium]
MKTLFLLAAALLCACSGPRGAGPASKSAAVVFQKQTFKLLKTPDPDFEAALEGLLSASYEAAVKAHAGDSPLEIGFGYSLSPKGAVYPFSEIEVSCLMQARYASGRGPELCGDFFGELGRRVQRALAARQQ